MKTTIAKFKVFTDDDKKRVTVIPYYAIRDSETYKDVLTSIAINCIKALGLVEGMEGAKERVEKLLGESSFAKKEDLPEENDEEIDEEIDEDVYNDYDE